MADLAQATPQAGTHLRHQGEMGQVEGCMVVSMEEFIRA